MSAIFASEFIIKVCIKVEQFNQKADCPADRPRTACQCSRRCCQNCPPCWSGRHSRLCQSMSTWNEKLPLKHTCMLFINSYLLYQTKLVVTVNLLSDYRSWNDKFRVVSHLLCWPKIDVALLELVALGLQPDRVLAMRLRLGLEVGIEEGVGQGGFANTSLTYMVGKS